MRGLLPALALLLGACEPRTEGNGQPLRLMRFRNVSVQAPAQPSGAVLVKWEVYVHSCDPLVDLGMTRPETAVVDIRVRTTPAPDACTTEGEHFEEMGVIIPPDMLRGQPMTPVNILLNGSKVGQVGVP